MGVKGAGPLAVRNFQNLTRVGVQNSGRIAPVIVIFVEACLGKIWCKTGAKRGASGRAQAPSAGTRRAKRSPAQALAPRERRGGGLGETGEGSRNPKTPLGEHPCLHLGELDLRPSLIAENEPPACMLYS